MEQDTICFDRWCLRRHHKWARWAENLLPRIPDEGGWDGWEWKVPPKELKKYWKRRDEKEKEKETSKGGGEETGKNGREKSEEIEREKKNRTRE